MNASDLTELLERFFEPDFDDAAAQARLGRAAAPAGAERVDLVPADPAVAAAHLEHFRDQLVGVSLVLATGVPGGREAIEQRFGPFRDAARLHHDDPPRLEQTVHRPSFDGALVVEIAPGPAPAPLVGVVARRFPTAWTGGGS